MDELQRGIIMLTQPYPVLQRQPVRDGVARDAILHPPPARPTRRAPLTHAASVTELRLAHANRIREATASRCSEPIATRHAELIVFRRILGQLETDPRRARLDHHVIQSRVHRRRRATVACRMDISLTTRRAADVIRSAGWIVDEPNRIRADRHRAREQTIRSAVARPGAAPRRDPFRRQRPLAISLERDVINRHCVLPQHADVRRDADRHRRDQRRNHSATPAVHDRCGDAALRRDGFNDWRRNGSRFARRSFHFGRDRIFAAPPQSSFIHRLHAVAAI